MYNKLNELVKKHIAVIIIIVVVIELIEFICLIGLTASKNSLKRDYESTKRDYNDIKQDYIDYKKELNATPTPIPTETPEPTPQPTVAPTPEPTQPPQQNTQTSSTSKSNKYEVLCGQPCVFSDYSVTYNSFSLSTDYNGNPAIIENYTFKNSSAEARPFFTTASVTMYQDGIELQTAYMVSGCDLRPSQTKIQQGASLDVQYAHMLRNKTSPITIEIKDRISFGGIVYKGVIPLS